MIKCIKGFSPETVGALGEMLGDGVTLSLHNLEQGDVEPKVQGVNKPKTNLLDRKSQKRLGADAQPRYTLGYQLDHLWNKPKAVELERIGHNFITLTISL